MSSPASARAAAPRRAAVPTALILAALAVWLSLPDKTFVFDGVIFAQVVERSIDEWRREMLNPRHLLFNPFFQILRDGLKHAGIVVGAYRLFQVVNALAGAAGLLLFGDLARRLSRDEAVGWCAALLLGATWCYGTRATEGQVYMLMSLGAVAFLWGAVRLLERPSAARAAVMVGAASLGALFHAADAFLFPAAAAALWLAFPKRRGAALAWAAAGPVLLAIPYFWAFGGQGLAGFLGGATEFHSSAGGAGFWAGLFQMFWSGGGMTLPGRASLVLSETGSAIALMPRVPGIAAGLALWAAAAAAVARAWPRLDPVRRAQAGVIGAAWACFSAVNAFWPGGLFFYIPALACALAELSLAAGAFGGELNAASRRRALGGLAFAGLALGAWNVREGLVPQSLIENNAGYRQAMFVGAHTEPSSWIIISGLGFSNSKVYLPNFAHRTREVLEFYFDRNPKDVALRKLAAFSEGVQSHGIPIYLLSDLIESPGAGPILQQRFGVSMGEIQHAFGAGRVFPVASGPDERVYLFIPEARQPELFTVFGYSVLTESEPQRLNESIAAIKEIAREMKPADRRRAAELMRAKNWGFDLLWEGFGPVMSAESRAGVRARLQRFTDYQKTPDFWLRAGNLYGMLALKKETLDAWGRAESMSGDADLAKRIAQLRSSR